MPAILLICLVGDAWVKNLMVFYCMSYRLFASSLAPSSNISQFLSFIITHSSYHDPSQSNFRASIYILLPLSLAHFICQAYERHVGFITLITKCQSLPLNPDSHR
ncbi:hypothetical protein ILYODFUR_037871 [Ilyodon furcidens]|uniref:Uncharacterized protein n=1 Tax=Ilyodon furcidens TaxID=33524 RepID=A0ABV0T6V6_9TELE